MPRWGETARNKNVFIDRTTKDHRPLPQDMDILIDTSSQQAITMVNLTALCSLFCHFVSANSTTVMDRITRQKLQLVRMPNKHRVVADTIKNSTINPTVFVICCSTPASSQFQFVLHFLRCGLVCALATLPDRKCGYERAWTTKKQQ